MGHGFLPLAYEISTPFAILKILEQRFLCLNLYSKEWFEVYCEDSVSLYSAVSVARELEVINEVLIKFLANLQYFLTVHT
jgi:exonuclease V gamma subunit